MSSMRAYYNEQIKKSRKIRRIIFFCLGIFVIISLLIFIKFYKSISYPNVNISNGEKKSLYIKTDADFDAVKDSLYSNNLIINKKSFEWLAFKMNYPKSVKPGNYVLTNKMSNNELISMLRSGRQTPINVTFNNIRDIEQLSGRISEQIEADSLSILNAIINSTSLKDAGFDRDNLASLFIPNTYKFYWNTSDNEFITRMEKEYKIFWNKSRLEKAKKINLNPLQISILASIVDKETTKISEMPRIAGVYINRLKKHWPLQADPTLIYAIGNYNIHRVLDVYKDIESPYNTYKYTGLPPGPICIPSIAAIDAVLNAEQHKYFYFCAKDDLSGYHVFAKNINEHNINAKKYRKALNKNKIWK